MTIQLFPIAPTQKIRRNLREAELIEAVIRRDEGRLAASGAVVVERPDQYVANVLPLDAHAELSAFFAGFLLDRRAK